MIVWNTHGAPWTPPAAPAPLPTSLYHLDPFLHMVLRLLLTERLLGIFTAAQLEEMAAGEVARTVSGYWCLTRGPLEALDKELSL